MKSASRFALAIPALGLLAAGIAGCTSGTGTGQATPTPTPTTAAAVCPVGDWRSTQVASSASTGGVTVTLQGGSGVSLKVADGGTVNADFTGMQPIGFTGQVAGQEATGEFSYSGPISGMVSLGAAASPTASASPAASASPSASPSPAGSGAATGGSWTPAGQVTWGDLLITIRVTKPISATVVDNVKVSDVTGAQTTQAGGAIDLQPLLRPGQYSCQGDNLVINLSAGPGPGMTWTFARA